jgi:hypothetical protein
MRSPTSPGRPCCLTALSRCFELSDRSASWPPDHSISSAMVRSPVPVSVPPVNLNNPPCTTDYGPFKVKVRVALFTRSVCCPPPGAPNSSPREGSIYIQGYRVCPGQRDDRSIAGAWHRPRASVGNPPPSCHPPGWSRTSSADATATLSASAMYVKSSYSSISILQVEY